MNETMQISPVGTKFLQSQEGRSTAPYQDIAGNWTIGIGHLIRPGEHFTELSQDEITELLLTDLAAAQSCINQLVECELRQCQYDALCSFVFNEGSSAFAGSSLLKLLNKKDLAGAAEEFLKWVYYMDNGAKKISKGLVNRRAAERALFLS